MKSIVILIDYFGKWPPWFPVFLESCRANPSITWIFHTDCPVDQFEIENVKFYSVSWQDYVQFVSRKLEIEFNPAGPYKVNDLKPAFGYMYEDIIKGYNFFGYGDIDVIYGDLRSFLNDKVLERNVISTHTWCVSGHFALFKNEQVFRNAFRNVKKWKYFIETPEPQRFDEDIFSRVFRYPGRLPHWLTKLYDKLHPRSKSLRQKRYFKEQFSTPLTPSRWKDGSLKHPEAWFWRHGHLTNDKDGAFEFPYLHFMNYASARYMDASYGVEPLWRGIDPLVNFNINEISAGIRIDQNGFHLL